MAKMTVSIPDKLLAKLRKQHPEINWAEIVRKGIIEKLEKLEKLEKKGEL